MLILLGVLVLLLNLNLISLSAASFVLSIGILIRYFMNSNSFSLILGLILLGGSSIFLVDQYMFPRIDAKLFLFFSIFAAIAYFLYWKNKNRYFLLAGLFLSAIGSYSLVINRYQGKFTWVLFLLLSLSMYIYYLLEFKKSGIEWPKNIAMILLSISFMVFIYIRLSVKNLSFRGFLGIVLPTLLIAMGLKFLYDRYRES